MKTPRFWNVLEVLGARTASLKDFQERIGETEYPVVGRFIVAVESRDGNDPIVAGYPCERCRRMHTVEDAGNGTFVAYLESGEPDDEPDVICPDITGLTLDQVRKRQVAVADMARCLAEALTLKAEFRQRSSGLFLLGTTHERRAPVYLSIKGDDAGYLRDANALLGDTARPFILLTATPRASVAARFGRDGAHAFALSDIVTYGRDGTMAAVASAERLIGQGLPSIHALPIKGPPLSLKGKRYALADDYSAIARLRPKKVTYKITNHKCREALRVLVECGSDCLKQALTKQEWCEAVDRRLKPEGPWPKEFKPVSYFRVRRRGVLATVPFYDVIGTDGRGSYWLNL